MTGNEASARPARRAAGVVGAGTMGAGIAQCLATAGYPTVVVDPDPAALQRGAHRVRSGLRLDILTGRRKTEDSADIADITARIEWTDRADALADTFFVIECALEQVPVKQAVLAELDSICPPETVFASCTSAIPITRLGSFTARPDRVLGTHFMNPAPAKDTVEVIRAPATSQQTVDLTIDLLATMGKKAVVVADAPGFVSNRVLMLTINESIKVVQEDTADVTSVDQIFQDCFGHPMGPLRTADLIGLDTIRDSLLVLLEHTGDPRFTPCSLLDAMVERGDVGRKSGQGFHTYPVAR
jgi:3-hydroxybutyryl-CoA dehydrogenase